MKWQKFKGGKLSLGNIMKDMENKEIEVRIGMLRIKEI